MNLRKKNMEQKKYKYERTCILCDNIFKTNNEKYQSCYTCFKFFRQFGGIKDYNEFLEAFEVKDGLQAKEEYIKFCDNVKKFKDINGDWKVDKILEKPGEFLDKVKIKN